MGELTLMKCKSKVEEWIVKEKNGFGRLYYVHYTEDRDGKKKIAAVKWTSCDREMIATNFDIRAMMEIVEKGGYKLEGEEGNSG